jgi:hypothetical protein
MQLTWRQVMAWRTERHHLHRRASRKKMLDVIARIGGLHAQLLSSAELTLWARVARRAAEEEADRLAEFLGGTLELTWQS